MGIGNLLLIKVAEVVRALSSENIWLGVWDQNRQAISFYEKHGFSVVGSQQFKVGNDVQPQKHVRHIYEYPKTFVIF